MMTILVAYTKEGRSIGLQGMIPWRRIVADLARFRRLTMGKVVIMGRKTFDSFGTRTALPGRTKFVVTQDPSFYGTNPDYAGYGTLFFGDLEEAHERALRVTDRRPIYLIGGGQLYREGLRLGLVDEILATEIRDNAPGDVTFPPLGPEWVGTVEEERARYQFVRYVPRVASEFPHHEDRAG